MRTLIKTFVNSSVINRLMILLSEEGMSEEFHEHFMDMFEYQPHVKETRSLWLYVTDDGKVDLEINCYGIEITNTFEPSARLRDALLGNKVTDYASNFLM